MDAWWESSAVFSPQGNTLFMTQPRAFPLPADLGNGPMTIAVRMWMSPPRRFTIQTRAECMVRQCWDRAAVIQALLRLGLGRARSANESDFLEIWILLTGMLVALALFWMDRGETAYLLLALTCISLAVYPFLIVAGSTPPGSIRRLKCLFEFDYLGRWRWDCGYCSGLIGSGWIIPATSRACTGQ